MNLVRVILDLRYRARTKREQMAHDARAEMLAELADVFEAELARMLTGKNLGGGTPRLYSSHGGSSPDTTKKVGGAPPARPFAHTTEAEKLIKDFAP